MKRKKEMDVTVNRYISIGNLAYAEKSLTKSEVKDVYEKIGDMTVKKLKHVMKCSV